MSKSVSPANFVPDILIVRRVRSNMLRVCCGAGFRYLQDNITEETLPNAAKLDF